MPTKSPRLVPAFAGLLVVAAATTGSVAAAALSAPSMVRCSTTTCTELFEAVGQSKFVVPAHVTKLTIDFRSICTARQGQGVAVSTGLTRAGLSHGVQGDATNFERCRTTGGAYTASAKDSEDQLWRGCSVNLGAAAPVVT